MYTRYVAAEELDSIAQYKTKNKSNELWFNIKKDYIQLFLGDPPGYLYTLFI